MDNDGVSLPILDGKNYQKWKLRIQSILEVKDLDEVVYGQDYGLTEAEAATKTEGDQNAAHKAKTFKEKSARAKNILINAVDDQFTRIIQPCKTPREIWKRIETEFADSEPTNLQSVLTEFYSCKMDASQSVSEYLAHIEDLVDKLKAANHEVSEEATIAKVVSSLPGHFADFRRTWNMFPTSLKSMKLLIENLKKEEKALRRTQVPSEALIMRTVTKRNRLSKQQIQERKKSTQCRWCKQAGHWWKECPSRPADKSPSDQKSKKPGPGPSKQQEQPPVEYAMMAVVVDGTEESTGYDSTWYLDSCASEHMTAARGILDEYQVLDTPRLVKAGDGKFVYAVGVGSVQVVSRVAGKECLIRLKHVYYIPKLSNNLFSVGSADNMGVKFVFSGGEVLIYSKNNELIASGEKLSSKIYRLSLQMPIHAKIMRAERTLEEWHNVLGHAGQSQIQQLAKSGCVDGMIITSNPRREEQGCGDCQAGRAIAASHPESSRPRASSLLERLHVDLVGPISPPSYGGNVYFLSIKDEYSAYMFAEFMVSKTQVVDKLIQFVDKVETVTQAKVRIIRSDNGTEFKNQAMSLYLEARSISQEFSAAYTPEQNGEAERNNRTIDDRARSMIQAAGLPLELWAEAVSTAVYVSNRMINKRHPDMTPFELFYGRKPNLAHLVKFGQPVHVIENRRRDSKFSAKTREAFVVGYGKRLNTYRCLIKGTKEIVTTCDVVPAHHKAISSESPHRESHMMVSISPLVTDAVSSEPTAEVSQRDPPPATPQPAPIEATESPQGHSQSPHNSTEVTVSEPSKDNGSRVAPTARGDETFVIRSDEPQAPDCLCPSHIGNESQPQSQVTQQASRPVVRMIVQNRPGETFQFSRTDKDTTTREQAAPSAPATSRSLESMQTQTAHAGPSVAPTPSTTTAPKTTSSQQVIDRLSPIVQAFGRPKRVVKPKHMMNLAVTMSREPASYEEAIESSDRALWVAAIVEELRAHHKNGTWEVVPKADGCKEISAKWVFKIKDNGDSPLFKARLVARGFSQQAGKDYGEIFSPVVRMDSVRLLFALCAQYDLEYCQFDIKTAFLNGFIDEELYLAPPKGLKIEEGHTCRLRRSLYGLKQAPRAWNARFTDVLSQYNLRQSHGDPCVFFATKPELLYVALYVDDGLVFGLKADTIRKLIEHLMMEFDVKIVDSNCFLGVEIERGPNSVFLHQRRYIQRVLDRFNMTECKTAATPLEVNHSLNRHEVLDTEPLAEVPYPEAIGSLLYCSGATRPDIAHSLSVLSKYSKSPRKAHWEATKRVMRYLKGTIDCGLMYKKVEDPRLLCYTDADWAGDQESRRSTSGLITMINTGPISFRSQQQPVVALSTTEAEYVAASLAVQELVWLRRFLSELKVPCSEKSFLLCDNQSALKLIRNPEFHQRTKHIDIRYHYIRDLYAQGLFKICYVPTEEQKADVFTKALTHERHGQLCLSIGCGPKKVCEAVD